jgi:zinc resistance-associated protein
MTMWKTLTAGTAVLAIAGASLAYAQKGPDGSERAHRWRPSAEDIGALADAKIAAIHAGLKLTAEQEKSWPAVEAALRDLSKQRSDRFAARASADKPAPKDPIERLALRADMMTQTGAALKKLADAADPLYKSLDEGQKHRLMILARLEGRHFGGEGGPRGHHGEGGWRMHRGPGADRGLDRGLDRGPGGLDGGPMGPDRGPRPQ